MTTSIGITSNDASYLTCGEIRSPESHWEEGGVVFWGVEDVA